MTRLERGRLDRPELAGEGDVLVLGQRLLAKEEDQMLDQRLLDRRPRGVRERAREIDARDVGSDRRRGGLDLDRHGRIPFDARGAGG